MNGINIGLESVRGDLEFSAGGLINLFREGHGIAGRASPKVPSQHELSVTLNSDEAIGIPAQRVTIRIPLFFASDESPNLITLNITHGQPVDHSLQKALAALSSEYQDVQDGIAVKARDSLNGAHRHTLYEQTENAGDFFRL
jgi:hypothetical protein